MDVRFYLKKWWVWLVVLAAGGLLIFFFTSGPKTSYQTEILTAGPLVQTVDVSGEVVSIDEVELAFDINGSLADVMVRIGQQVEKGAVLASLDTTELQADLSAAFQAVEYARANLAKQKAGQKDETVAVSSASVKGAEATFRVAQIDLENAQSYLAASKARYDADIASGKSAVQTAQANLRQTQKDNATALDHAYRDVYVSAWAGVISARTGLTQADDVLGIHNGFVNDEYETVISARDSGALVKAKDRFLIADASLESAESYFTSVSSASSSTMMMQLARLVMQALDDSEKLLMQTKKVVDATLNTSEFTVSDHTTLKSNVDSARNGVQADQVVLENAIQTVESTLDSTAHNLEDGQNALAQANANLLATQKQAEQQILSLTNTVTSTQATLSVREADVTKALASLSEVRSVPRTIDLASYEAEVARTSAAYQSAKARLDKAKIISPIAGNITAIDIKKGEAVTATKSIITVQTTQQQFKIVADISESDVAKVQVNDPVRLTFDALPTDRILHGFVGELNPAEKLIEGVVYYEATIFLDDIDVSDLRPGMSTDVVIETDGKPSVLSVQQRTLIQRDGALFIRVLKQGKPAERAVTTGMRGNLGRIEILSGLSEGDEVIIREIHE